MPVERTSAKRLFTATKQGHQTDTVERLPWPIAPGQLKKGRIEIHSNDRLSTLLTALNFSGPVHKKRYTNAALEIVALIAVQRSHVRRWTISAVVGEKEDNRVVALASFLELGHQTSHPFVDRLDHRRHDGVLMKPARLLCLIFFDDVALGLQRHMHGIMRQIGAPRFTFRAADELECFFRKHISKILPVAPHVSPHAGDFVVLHGNVESLLDRGRAKVPFTKHPCAVTGLLQRLRPRDDIQS